jgi:hypothetical protein
LQQQLVLPGVGFSNMLKSGMKLIFHQPVAELLPRCCCCPAAAAAPLLLLPRCCCCGL